jgi:uncharacterized protein YoxC
MNNTLLLIFIGILACAVLAQSILFFLMYKSMRQLSNRLDVLSRDLLKQVQVITKNIEGVLDTVKGVADVLKPVAQKVADSVDIVHERIMDLDRFLGEMSDTARFEIARIQDTVHTATQRVQEAIDAVRDGILTPINQVTAITQALRVAMDVLFRNRRRSSRMTAQDEELFI